MPIKLTVHKTPDVSAGLSGHVRISPEAEVVIRQLMRETGLSARSIVSQIVIQSAEQIEICEI